MNDDQLERASMKKLSFIPFFLGLFFLAYGGGSVSFANSLDWPKILTQRHGDLEALEGGYTNEAFVLTHQSKKYVVKRLAPNALDLGINRALEFDFQQSAATRGLTSHIHHIDEEKGFYVADYLEGSALTSQELHKRENLVSSIRLVKELHKRTRPKNYKIGSHILVRIQGFMEKLRGQNFPHLEVLERGYKHILAIEKDLPQGAYQVAAHNDFFSANIIHHQGTLKTIDWEYAGWSSPYNDLTLLVVEDFLPDESHEVILETYFGKPTQIHRDLFQKTLVLQRFMVLCWYGVQLSRGIENNLSKEYQQRFEEHLKVFQTSVDL